MWPFRRRKPKQYSAESISTQLKIIRTHMAALSGEMSTMRVQLMRQNDQAAIMLQKLDGPTK